MQTAVACSGLGGAHVALVCVVVKAVEEVGVHLWRAEKTSTILRHCCASGRRQMPSRDGADRKRPRLLARQAPPSTHLGRLLAPVVQLDLVGGLKDVGGVVLCTSMTETAGLRRQARRQGSGDGAAAAGGGSCARSGGYAGCRCSSTVCKVTRSPARPPRAHQRR